MKIREYKNNFIQHLVSFYDKDEVENFFYLILKDVKKLSRVDLALHPELEFTQNELQKIEVYQQQLAAYKPIQYLLGKTEFGLLNLFVTPDVLIPRPETEELVEWIISENQKKAKLNILDIGTGSGAIAISLSKSLKSETFAFDISEKALEIAQKNADHNQTFVHFIDFDILTDTWQGDNFDIIVSNPPYVRELEKEHIKPNVLDNEPHLALFVTDGDPLIFYKRIADFALKHLNKDGQLYFEINQSLGKETISLLEQKRFENIMLRKDIYGNDRMILAYRS